MGQKRVPPGSNRPIVLLDLDGVPNPFAAPTCPGGYRERVFVEGEKP